MTEKTPKQVLDDKVSEPHLARCNYSAKYYYYQFLLGSRLTKQQLEGRNVS